MILWSVPGCAVDDPLLFQDIEDPAYNGSVIPADLLLVKPDHIPLPFKPGELPFGKMPCISLDDADRLIEGTGRITRYSAPKYPREYLDAGARIAAGKRRLLRESEDKIC